MGLFDRFRRTARDDASGTTGQREVGPSERDLEDVRRALLREAQRLGRPQDLSLSAFLEHADARVARMDLHAIVGHLAATGDLANVRPDSMGNTRFDVTPMVEKLRG
ncbi:MAG TPA: hypothetical protein QGF05_11235 [Dehalococcoidia bacterium]|nr:hypothetical protein [Dehalococcoidia bacterium]